MSPPSLWGLGSSLPSPLRSKELILGENVPARFTPPVGKLSGTPYAGHSLVRFPSIASASVTCPSPFPCVSLSPPTTQTVPPWALQGWTLPLFFVTHHANHTHSCLARPALARTHLPPPARSPGGCVLETSSAGVAKQLRGKNEVGRHIRE